jgi:hypothetical protein
VYNKQRSRYEAPEIGIANKNRQQQLPDISDIGMKDFNLPQSCCTKPDTQGCLTAVRDVTTQQLSSRDIYMQASKRLLRQSGVKLN